MLPREEIKREVPEMKEKERVKESEKKNFKASRYISESLGVAALEQVGIRSQGKKQG